MKSLKKVKRIKKWCSFYGRIPAIGIYEYIGPRYIRCPKCNTRLKLIIRGCECCNPEVIIASISRHKYRVKEI